MNMANTFFDIWWCTVCTDTFLPEPTTTFFSSLSYSNSSIQLDQSSLQSPHASISLGYLWVSCLSSDLPLIWPLLCTDHCRPHKAPVLEILWFSHLAITVQSLLKSFLQMLIFSTVGTKCADLLLDISHPLTGDMVIRQWVLFISAVSAQNIMVHTIAL